MTVSPTANCHVLQTGSRFAVQWGRGGGRRERGGPSDALRRVWAGQANHAAANLPSPLLPPRPSPLTSLQDIVGALFA